MLLENRVSGRLPILSYYLTVIISTIRTYSCIRNFSMTYIQLVSCLPICGFNSKRLRDFVGILPIDNSQLISLCLRVCLLMFRVTVVKIFVKIRNRTLFVFCDSFFDSVRYLSDLIRV